MNEIQLHDIKGLVAIPDYSFYIFIALVILGFIIVISLIYFLIRHFKNKDSIEKQAYDILLDLNFNDAKKAAYTITKYGRVLVHNDREKKLFEELIESLEQYKYKKEVEEFDETTKEHFNRFMDAVDVK